MSKRAVSLLVTAWLALQHLELATADCCFGSDSACDTSSQSACLRLAKRKGCEWRTGSDADCASPPGCCFGYSPLCLEADESYCTGRKGQKSGCTWLEGTADNPPDCTAPTPEPGCCYGSDEACQNAEDESTCSTRSNKKKGCEWRAGSEADCSPVPGCCYGAAEECWEADVAYCVGRSGKKKNCEWREGTAANPPDCTPPTEEPGCCYGFNDMCASADTMAKCTINKAKRAGCEWRSGLDANCGLPSAAPTMPPAPTVEPTEEPTSTAFRCGHRHRKSWAEISDAERELYITGFKKLSDMGVTTAYTLTHIESSEHNNPVFLPWHREFIFRFESDIRSLGPEYECFTLPYWDFTNEPIPNDIKSGASDYSELVIMNSGLGGDSNGKCLQDDVWGAEAYQTTRVAWTDVEEDDCLIRDLDYESEEMWCTFFSAPTMMATIDYSNDYGSFRPYLEGVPHVMPHACIGGDVYAHMATFYSPDDPIFYLHHSFMDYIWALWQDCNDYDGAEVYSYSAMYSSDVDYALNFMLLPNNETTLVRDTFDLANYDVSYEKGAFWDNAFVDSLHTCGMMSDGSGKRNPAIPDDPTNDAWFYTEVTVAGDNSSASKQQALSAEGFFFNKKNMGRKSESIMKKIKKQLTETFPDMSPGEVIAETSFEGCMFEQMAGSGVWEKPAQGMPDCSVFPIDPDTGDRDISLQQMVDPAFGLTDKQIALRTKMYGWAQIMNERFYLCAGCYDRFCDNSVQESGICDLNTNSHDGEYAQLRLAVNKLFGQLSDKVHDNLNLVVMVTAVLLLFAARKCMERDERNKSEFIEASVREMSYGAI